jgi:hypothetical protein
MYVFYYDAESQAPAAAPKHEEEDEDEDEDEFYQEDGLLYLLSAHIHSSVGDLCTCIGGGRALPRSQSIHTYQGAIKALQGLY